MASNIEVEIEMKTPAEKVWSNLKEFATVFPKALPHIFKKFEVIEGDGEAVGSILVTTFSAELENVWTTTKEKIELVDEEKKILSYRYIEGEILKYYKNHKATIYVSSKNDGNLIKYLIEFEKANEETPHPDFFRDFVVKVFKDLDVFLRVNGTFDPTGHGLVWFWSLHLYF